MLSSFSRHDGGLFASRLFKTGVKLGKPSMIPHWDEKKCLQCYSCTIICPHGSIHPFFLSPKETKQIKTAKSNDKEMKDYQFRIQVSPNDCIGCGVCTRSCPTGSLEMIPRNSSIENEEIKNWEYFISILGEIAIKTRDSP